MARGRHAKPSGLLARLLPGRTARRREAERQRALLRLVAGELRHLRALADTHAAAAEQAEARARFAEQQVVAAQAAIAGLRLEVGRLREELAWAWAEGRLPAASLADGLQPPAQAAEVIDLREATSA